MEKIEFAQKVIELVKEIPENHKQDSMDYLIQKMREDNVMDYEVDGSNYNEGWNDALESIKSECYTLEK